MASLTAIGGAKGRTYKVRWYDASRHGQRARCFKTEAEAKAYKVKIESSLLDGSYRDPKLGKVAFGDYLARTFDVRPMSRTHRDRRLKPKTLAWYEHLAKRWLQEADFDEADELRRRAVGRVSSDLLESYFGALEDRVGPPTVHAVYRMVRRTLAIAIEKGLAPAPNPCGAVRVARPGKHEVTFLTADQLAGLAEVVPPWDRALVLLLGYGGLRWGEAVALQRRHIDPLRGRVLVQQSIAEVGGHLVMNSTPKGGSSRAVRIPRAVAEALAEHLGTFVEDRPDAWVFTTVEGSQLRNSNWRRNVYDRACAKVGLDPKPRIHDLRHTAVALAIAAGYHPKAVQEMLGHSSITVTMDVYGHLFETLQDEAVDRLDAIARAAVPVAAGQVVPIGAKA